MPTRPTPVVPHHSVVRAIGRGSYGEIWLARSLTGAWRAVKIVERARFDDSRAFDREFDGMAKFEPVSREHGGFIDILHVGRSDDDAFFYYVMELADDVVPREVFNPELYQPKTLKSELQRVARLPAEESIALGLSLTLALAALHRHGLVHRDIKPANIIFVGGQPKIADIGLVSQLGQGSFVGTEGYVPPEGPGTAQADLFSLGKVIYELAMGKDRLDFPEVNTDLDVLPDRDLLIRLNHVLWRACAHDSSARYATADEMREDLERVRDGRPLTGDIVARRKWIPVVALLAATVSGYAWWKSGKPAPIGKGSVFIETDPPGARIRVESVDGRWLTTPGALKDVPAGSHVAHAIAANFDPLDFPFEIRPGQETRVPKIVLQRSKATAHFDSVPHGVKFELRGGDRVFAGVAPTQFEYPTGDYEVVFFHQGHEKSQRLQIERGGDNLARAEFLSRILRVTSYPPGADIFCDGKAIGKAPCDLPLLEGKHALLAKYGTWPEDKREIVVGDGEPEAVAFAFATGSVKISSKPVGAEVYQGSEKVGETPFFKEDLAPGEVKYTLKLEKYQPKEVTAAIQAGRQVWEKVVFDARGPRRGEAWDNSLGMRFAPVGDLLAGVWLVRVRDFAAYSAETGRPRLPVDFPQDENHPVVRMNWEDAMGFCEWLTQHERAVGKLDEGQYYRLPTDAEWSLLAGMPEEGGATPERRDGMVRDFLWGKQWPPPANVGNFGDMSFRQGSPTRVKSGHIANYTDGFAYTSPVGTFPSNRHGIFDVSGNVWQWVSDSYNGGTQKKDWGVLRGGCWGTSKQEELRLGYRNVISREERDVIFGFRCVIDMAP